MHKKEKEVTNITSDRINTETITSLVGRALKRVLGVKSGRPRQISQQFAFTK